MKIPEAAYWVLVPPLAIAGFVLFWNLVVAAIARLGGWRALAERYGGSPAVPGEALGLCSLFLSGGLLTTRYNNAVHIDLGPEGLAVSPSFLFRRSHPPLLIPWDRIERCERRRLLFFEVTEVVPRECPQRLLIRGAAGERVHSYWVATGRS